MTLPQPCKVVFWVPMPKSWSKRKRQMLVGRPHKQRPDLDNMEKALFDALFGEDSHIWSVWGEKRWGTHGAIEVVPLYDIVLDAEAA